MKYSNRFLERGLNGHLELQIKCITSVEKFETIKNGDTMDKNTILLLFLNLNTIKKTKLIAV